MYHSHDIRLIGLDLDGTVFNDQKQITPRTLAAIQAAAQKGVIVLPATGRPLSGLPPVFLSVPGVEYALTSNGAAVTRLRDKTPILRQYLDPRQALIAFSILEEYPCMNGIFIGGTGYISRWGHAHIPDFALPNMVEYMRATRHPVDDAAAFVREHAGEIEKFSICMNDPQAGREAWQRIAAATDLTITSSPDCTMEINASGVDKGQALLALAAQFGFGPQNVMACGDSGNDVAMLRKAGLGVAMANASEEAKQAADCLTDSNNDDGVAKAIERYVL